MSHRTSAPSRHPITADQIRPGDPYELSEGRLVECLPTGRRGARSSVVGGAVLDADPAVEAAARDLGVSPRPDMLRAPDLAVGAIPDEPGWSPTAPALVVEYADTGQDEAELHTKIHELLDAGTRWIWVVRLVGVRRVEVYEAATAPVPLERPVGARARRPAPTPVRVAHAGEALEAPGVLKNPVPVEALWDRQAAHEATLRNLLQRKGYADLAAVREEGQAEGLAAGQRTALLKLLQARFGPLPASAVAKVTAADAAALDAWLDRMLSAASLADVLDR